MFHSDLTSRPIGAPMAVPALDTGEPDFVVIDVETSCSRVSSICQIGIVGFRGGAVTFEYETLLDPRDHFSSFNTRIHGITADHVAGEPCFAEVHSVVDGHLTGRTTVAHSYFDKGAISAACRVHSRQDIATTWLDSVRVAKRAWPDLSSHRLNVLSRHLGIAHRHHDALSDARAAGFVIVKASEHTGMTLADWLAPSVRRNAGPPPKPASDGPLRGQRVAILGEPRDGRLAHVIASLGGRVVSAVGTTTTILAIVGEEPFGFGITHDADFRRVEELRRAGGSIRILAEGDVTGHVIA
jgi:DNA polymerase-3 subunit epsilon